MSVIAKMYARQRPRPFPKVQQVDLECVCDDRLFTINEPIPGRVRENQTFSQASPQGDCRFQLDAKEPIGMDEEFYLVFLKQKDCPAFDKALVVSRVYCMSITDYGGTSKHVDVSSTHRSYSHMTGNHEEDSHPRQTWSFTMRMMIDNPAASIQFKPSEETYWLGIYRAKEVDLHEALADAQPPAPAASEVDA